MFNNTLLIVNFNYSADTKNKNFFKEIYQHHFKDIIFYSDKPDTSDQEINFIHTNKGKFTHRIFIDFYSKYKEIIDQSDGVFYTHDDNVINTNILSNFSTDRIIFHKFKSCLFPYYDDSFEFTLQQLSSEESKESILRWVNWNKCFGIKAIKSIINNPINIFSNNFSDCFYLPKQYFDHNLIDLFYMFKDVFLEISIPSIIKYIEKDNTNYHTFNSEIVWTNKDKLNNIEYLKKIFIHNNCLFVHPIKFTKNPILKDYISNILSSEIS